MTQTIFWHDYEAGGTNPRADRPLQFAGIRTNSDLQEIGEPINLYCRLAPDYLPHPEACLLTGISPLQVQRDGLPEVEFARRVQAALSEPGTISAGYNNLRYDEVLTRFTFYRNLLDPYRHAWAQGNSRWDLLPLVRACYALRPAGLVWPEREDGKVSLKLEHLTAANQIEHAGAHDAVSDVRATIALARIIKAQQPGLFEYSMKLRHKKTVVAEIQKAMGSQAGHQAQLMVHVDGRYGPTQGYCSWILPLGFVPDQPNLLVAWRLDRNPQPWLGARTDQLRAALTGTEATSERPGLIRVPVNQCPFLAPPKTLSPERAADFGLDWQQAQHHASHLTEATGLRDNCLEVASQLVAEPSEPADVDTALYEGFFDDQARQHMAMIHQQAPEQLAAFQPDWTDPRLPELFFRFRARNYPTTLSEVEQEKWRRHCQQRLQDGAPGYLSLTEYALVLERLAEQYAQDHYRLRLLKDLYQYARDL